MHDCMRRKPLERNQCKHDGGPAGLYAAFYSGMRDMKVKLIGAKEELGAGCCSIRRR